MKRRVIIAIFLPALLMSCTGQKSPEGIDFRASAEQWKEAYNSGDAGKLLPLYAEDAEYISSHVPGLMATGRDRVIANFARGMSMGGHIDSVEVLSTVVSTDLACIVTRYVANNAGQRAEGRNLLVMRKVGRKWLIVKHMTVV